MLCDGKKKRSNADGGPENVWANKKKGMQFFKQEWEITRLVSTPVLRTEAECKAYQGVEDSTVEGKVADYDIDRTATSAPKIKGGIERVKPSQKQMSFGMNAVSRGRESAEGMCRTQKHF